MVDRYTPSQDAIKQSLDTTFPSCEYEGLHSIMKSLSFPGEPICPISQTPCIEGPHKLVFCIRKGFKK